MEILDIRTFERHATIKHCIQHHSSTPDIHSKALIAIFIQNFRGDVGRSTTLLMNALAILYDLADTKVPNFYMAFAVQKDIVQLYVSMQNLSGMNVTNTQDDLLEDQFCHCFVQFSSFSDVCQQVPSCTEF